MALKDNATLKIGYGNYFIAPPGTAFPTSLTSIPAEWENLGHTSLEDILANDSEGGEATVLGTLQNPNLRTSYSARTENFTVNLQQFDADSLKLYFGSNMETVDGDLLGVPINPAPTEKAWMAVYYDGANAFAFYAPKVEIMRQDNLELSDTESLASLPLSIRPLNYGDNKWPYAVKPIGPIIAA